MKSYALFLIAILFAFHFTAHGQVLPTVSDGQVSAINTETSAPMDLKIAKVTVHNPEELNDQLEKNGVTPDSDAHSLIYELNPSLSSIEEIKGNITVSIPAANTGDTLTKILLGQTLKSSIRMNTAALATVPSVKYANSIYKSNTIDISRDAVTSLTELTTKFDTVPSSYAFVSQTEKDSERLTDLYKQPALSNDDTETAHSILEDLAIKVGWISSGKNDPDVRVQVLSSEGKQVGLLTVCFVQVIDAPTECANTFEQPTQAKDPPTDKRIPVANYQFWAQDSSGHRRTELKRVDVREDKTVTLMVAP